MNEYLLGYYDAIGDFEKDAVASGTTLEDLKRFHVGARRTVGQQAKALQYMQGHPEAYESEIGRLYPQALRERAKRETRTYRGAMGHAPSSAEKRIMGGRAFPTIATKVRRWPGRLRKGLGLAGLVGAGAYGIHKIREMGRKHQIANQLQQMGYYEG